MTSSGFSKPTSEFRACLPDLDIPRFTIMKKQNCREYAHDFKTLKQPPWLHALYMHWLRLYQEPFKGVTVDGRQSAMCNEISTYAISGVVRDSLFTLQDEGVPIDTIAETARKVLSKCNDEQRAKVCYHIDSPEWRTWSNPEFLLSDKGLRLEDLPEDLRNAILKVLEVSLSPEGYEKALSAIRINHFLGELVQTERVMNMHSYNFALFGNPSTTRPWGFTFYGHHLCLNIFFYKRQMIISPWFTGAEPNEIDKGPWVGTTIMRREEAAGLELMQSLSPELQKKAQIYKLMKDPAMPPGRWNRDDQRHLCGAYRDNRIVPNEGITMSEMGATQKELVAKILDEFLLYLPAKARAIRKRYILRFESETYFCWIGGFTNDDPFYYRIQNPVVVIEFDHHSGVFLTNQEPKKFHIHTCFRTPNAGDYGMALRRIIPGIEDDLVLSDIVL